MTLDNIALLLAMKVKYFTLSLTICALLTVVSRHFFTDMYYDISHFDTHVLTSELACFVAANSIEQCPPFLHGLLAMTQIAEQFPPFYGSGRYYHVHKSLPLDTFWRMLNPVLILLNNLF
jgi:hypothetical protein